MVTARPVRVSSSFGPVDLVPGAIWQRDKMLVGCGDMVVHYISGEQLFEWNTMTLVRDTWLTGLQHGAARARWLCRPASPRSNPLSTRYARPSRRPVDPAARPRVIYGLGFRALVV